MTLDQYLSLSDTLSAAELGAKVGLSEASISRIRNGAQNPSRDSMLRIIEATDGLVTAEGLVRRAAA